MHDKTNIFYRMGGIAAVAIFALYVVITLLFLIAGARPVGVQQWLVYIGAHRMVWWGILALSVATDLLFLPLLAALHKVLSPTGRVMTYAGIGLVTLFVILDLAITWPHYGRLISLSGRFAMASADTARTAAVSDAASSVAAISSILFSVYAIAVPALGILLLGIPMLKSSFSRAAAYLGFATGLFATAATVGGVFTPRLALVSIAASVLTMVWALVVGIRLLGTGNSQTA